MKFSALLLGMILAAGLARAETDPAEAARAAADQLEAASVRLQKADGARDRVAALTETVKAYESGLGALREGLRRAAIREAHLARQLKAQEADIARLLGVLQSMGLGPPPVMLLHPAGPTGTARSGMILADVAPSLERQAAILRHDLEEVAILRSLQEGAAETLQEGLTGVQSARQQLSEAISDRTDLPLRFTDDPIRTALLIASTETLEGFASGLTEMQGDTPVAHDEIDVFAQKGTLALPVEAQVLRRSGEADAAGVRRPGLVLATRARALVSTPVAATIRYRGPLLDYGNVIIVEPEPGLMFVFAGLETVFGDTGQVIPPGTPLGLMGGSDAEIGSIVSQSGDGTGNGTGNDRSETLYIEVRENKISVDPETWFKTNKDN